MTRTWTPEQQAAICANGSNILVSAAAGAGKTAVLVERIIRFLCDRENPLDIDRLLVVTFTEAAAAEMRERIAAALEKEISVSGRYELARQLSLLNGASISTLHSFCLEIIRRYFYLLDMDPSFHVADESEAQMLRHEAVQDVMEKAFTAQDADFLMLAADYGGKRSDEDLTGLVLKLYTFAWSNPLPYSWLAAAEEMFDIEESNADPHLLELWLQPVREHLQLLLQAAAANLQEAARICGLPDGPYSYEKLLLRELEMVSSLINCMEKPWEALREAWLGIVFDRLPPAKKDVDEILKERVKLARDRIKEDIKEAGVIYFTRTLQEYQTEMKDLAPKIRALTQLVSAFARHYQAAKRQAGILDFSDLEHYALEILRQRGEDGEIYPSAAAVELRSRFEYVLVDEYQDINPVQDAILQLVSRQEEDVPNLFMVGDVKQSIYRFRLGEPGLFLAKYSTYHNEKNKAPGNKILLRHNFRCRSNVVNAVNFFFAQLMTADAMEIAYDEDAALVCGAQYPDCDNSFAAEPVEVLLLDKTRLNQALPSAENIVANDEDLSAFEREALLVAEKIQELVCVKRVQIYDKESDSYRPISYRDIVILLRSTANRADKIAEVLARQQVPAYAELSTGYFAATEVETMLSLLQVIDNPEQDIPLAAVLRSPFVGCTPAELAAIRIAGGNDHHYWEAVQLAATADIPALSVKLHEFLIKLDHWRTLARRGKLAAFIAEVYHESRYADYVAGLPDGVRRQANLRALFTRARQFDRFARQGLSRFLQFIEQLRSQGEDLGTARTLGETEDVVRIMSIHKSKGLEFPVVFLCEIGKAFNLTDQRSTLMLHREYGLAPLIVDTVNRIRYPSLPYLTQRLIGEAETRAEELRILYVALTRAREKLIMVGSADRLDEKMELWKRQALTNGGQLPPYRLRSAGSFLDWLGEALGGHPDFFQLVMLPAYSQVAAAKEADPAIECMKQALAQLLPLPNQSNEENHMDVLIQDERIQRDDIRKIARECLNYTYHQPPAAIAAKLSVTEIKRRYARELTDDGVQLAYPQLPWKRPAFLAAQKGLNAAELGTLYHRAFQHLDLNNAVDAAGIAQQLQYLAEKNLIGERELDALDPAKIAAFFATEAGRIALAHRNTVMREWPFTLAVPADELLAGQKDNVIIQGIIDMLIAVPGGMVLVDYKTDRLPIAGLAALAPRYQLQTDFYIRAVETILHQPVRAVYLYSLTAGEAIRLS